MTDALKRFSAPISPAVWAAIDETAASVLRARLSARAIVDFNGPLGWDADALGMGRTKPVEKGGADKVAWGLRQAIPLLEAKLPFTLSLDELDNLERGAKDIDLDAVEAAAKNMAAFEENCLYNGLAKAGITGILSGADTKAVSTAAQPEALVDAVAAAMAQLRENDIDGPYVFVGGQKSFGLLSRIMHGGGAVGKIIEAMTGATPKWSPAVAGAALISARGGDYELTVGQDVSVGYARHDNQAVHLYLIETLAFRVIEPRAAVEIKLK